MMEMSLAFTHPPSSPEGGHSAERRRWVCGDDLGPQAPGDRVYVQQENENWRQTLLTRLDPPVDSGAWVLL